MFHARARALSLSLSLSLPLSLFVHKRNELWGDHGYFKIKRGTNECQIEDAIINGGPAAGMPKI